VTEESDVMIITEHGKVIRVHANEIREAGRSTQGVRLLKLDGEDPSPLRLFSRKKTKAKRSRLKPAWSAAKIRNSIFSRRENSA